MQNVVVQSALEAFDYLEKEARWNQPVGRWFFPVLSRDVRDGERDPDLPPPTPPSTKSGRFCVTPMWTEILIPWWMKIISSK